MTRHNQDIFSLALDLLGCEADVHYYERRGLVLYRDSPTCAWWLVNADDVEALGDMIAAEVEDAYSRWCSFAPGQEIDPTEIVRTYGADEDTDLAALQAEAGAADDMPSYMALRYLGDEIEAVIELDAEIAAEQEDAA